MFLSSTIILSETTRRRWSSSTRWNGGSAATVIRSGSSPKLRLILRRGRHYWTDGQSKFPPCVHRNRIALRRVAKGNQEIPESPRRLIGQHSLYSAAWALGHGRLHRRF